MTNKDIKKAAERSTEKYVENGDLRGFRGSYRLGFISGADWRINSVWHDVKDIPKESSAILAIRPDGSTEIVYFINLLRWRSLIKRCGFFQWAYIKDLIPNKEGEQ
jgi:hypothetical protein